MLEFRDVLNAEGAAVIDEAIVDGRVCFAVQDICAISNLHEVLYGECLARLYSSGGRLCEAGEFVPCMEALGVVPMLDQRILGLVLDRLDADAGIVLGCNLSADNLRNEATWEAILGQVRGRPHLAERLVLELTETQSLRSVSFAASVIAGIRQLGCRVALDDFGTGFAAPGLLPMIEFDIIKIGGEFIHHARRATDGWDSARHLVGFASCFAPVVVIEGVEIDEQVQAARAAGATHVQGHLLSVPIVSNHVLPIMRGG